ncbi:Eukaryotic translation initiation factor 3 subunit H [Fusarium oxysporum f. sp. albedinis]|nr:Eukaryotic translation initiation factor 3 subunit H [Fusarium oxysporum f. sp. albedinis]
MISILAFDAAVSVDWKPDGTPRQLIPQALTSHPWFWWPARCANVEGSCWPGEMGEQCQHSRLMPAASPAP